MRKDKLSKLLRELKIKLKRIYGDDLVSIMLFGSWARGEATEESDIDVAIILKGKISPGQEIDRIIDVITELNLKYDVLLSVYPLSQEIYETRKSPILSNLRREGIRI